MQNTIDQVTLRKVQLTQLEILIAFDEVCKANGLPYQMYAGTLLGAVRHKGFIPWDDDIDVAMARPDYEKLLELYTNDGAKYFLQNYDSDKLYFRQFSRLRKNGTVYLQKGYKNIVMHHGIFIDIFPLDEVRPGSWREYFRCKKLYILARLDSIRNKGVDQQSNILKRSFGKLILASNNLVKKSTFDRFVTKRMKLYNGKQTGYLNHLTNGVTKKRFEKYLMKNKDFFDMTELEFEGYKFPAPRNYHAALTRLYGNYMELPPPEMRKPHHGIIKIELEEGI